MSLPPSTEKLGGVGGIPFEENALYRTSIFENIEELEKHVESWGLSEGQPKLVLSASCFEKPEDCDPRWKTTEPFETTNSISSMLEIACQMNPGSEEVPDYAEVIVGLKDDFILTACFHSDPRIVRAGGLPYKVVIRNEGLASRLLEL